VGGLWAEMDLVGYAALGVIALVFLALFGLSRLR
jgi:hypothetical protein